MSRHNVEESMVIKDGEELKNIFVQLNIAKNTCKVLSNFSAWENLAYFMEALAVTVEKCVVDGIPRKKVHEEIVRYMTQVIGTYSLKKI